MTTADTHVNRASAVRTTLLVLLTVLLAAVAAVAVPDGRAARTQAPVCSYGWPVKPFHRQHPVRGLFGDPRIGRDDDGSISQQFHFGIDVSAPNGTAVYATQSGTVTLPHPDVVAIVAGNREFAYWHVIPTVPSGTHAVAYRTLIGRIQEPWAHVHFAESVGGVFLNPLRPGALGPYTDATKPTVRSIRLAPDGAGRLDLIADVFDATPLTVAPPWAGKPVMPALVYWRLRGPEVAASGWRTALDFRETIPDASRFFAVYAAGTRQNLASVQARYRVYLARGVDLRSLPSGRYTVEVVAADGHGNSARGVVRFAVRNGAAVL
jgi:hypothetical protein